MLTIPHGKPIERVLYTVQSSIEPVTFYRMKDAKLFTELLNKSSNFYDPAIIRREITKEGYIPTYGEHEND